MPDPNVRASKGIETVPGGKGSVLIIHDNRNIYVELEERLQEKGITTRVTDTLDDGIEYYAELASTPLTLQVVVSKLWSQDAAFRESIKKIKPAHPNAEWIVLPNRAQMEGSNDVMNFVLSLKTDGIADFYGMPVGIDELAVHIAGEISRIKEQQLTQTPNAYVGALADAIAEGDFRAVSQLLSTLADRWPNHPLLQDRKLTVYQYAIAGDQKVATMEPLAPSTHLLFSLEKTWNAKVYKTQNAATIDHLVLTHFSNLYSELGAARNQIDTGRKGRAATRARKSLQGFIKIFPTVNSMGYPELKYVLDTLPKLRVISLVNRDYQGSRVRITEQVQAPTYLDILPFLDQRIENEGIHQNIAILFKEGMMKYISRSTAFLHCYLPYLMNKLPQLKQVGSEDVDFSENFKHLFDKATEYFDVSFSEEELTELESSFDVFNKLYCGGPRACHRDPNPRHYLPDIGVGNWGFDIRKKLAEKDYEAILDSILTYVLAQIQDETMDQIIEDIVVECDFEKISTHTLEAEEICQATQHYGWGYNGSEQQDYESIFLGHDTQFQALMGFLVEGEVGPEKLSGNKAVKYMESLQPSTDRKQIHSDYVKRVSPYRFFRSAINRVDRNVRAAELNLKELKNSIDSCLPPNRKGQIKILEEESDYASLETALIGFAERQDELIKNLHLYTAQVKERKEYEHRVYDYYLEGSVRAFDALIGTLPSKMNSEVKHLRRIKDAVKKIRQSKINYDHLLVSRK